MTNFQNLSQWGWTPFFQLQLSLDEWSEVTPARVVVQQKSNLTVVTDSDFRRIDITPSMPSIVVGDWLLIDQDSRFIRLLERRNTFKRKAAGVDAKWQLLSSNIDTALIVSSMNEDFNENRIERYLALALESEIDPILVLTKDDIAVDKATWQSKISELAEQVTVLSINAQAFESSSALFDFLKFGQTSVLLGSSGVGKSTLVNTLSKRDVQTTGEIREDDAKGRHTTSSRYLVPLENGSLILDTPGMRELQLADCQNGIQKAFEDIDMLAKHCRFADCQHSGEPGCNVLKAIESGELSQRKLNNYIKLKEEETRNSRTIAQRRSADKSLGKFYKTTLKQAKRLKGRD